MATLDPTSFDLPTLAALAGAAVSRHVLDALHAEGFAGVRASHGYIVQRLLDGQSTVGELAADLGITQQAVSKSVAELESLGLVSRTVDAADSRVRRIALTDRGSGMVEAARAARRRLERRVARGTGDLAAARAAMVALLEATGELDAVRHRRVRQPDA